MLMFLKADSYKISDKILSLVQKDFYKQEVCLNYKVLALLHQLNVNHLCNYISNDLRLLDLVF